MNWRKKRVLVTGADGFIGSHLIERLLKNKAKVKAFVLYNSFNSWGWLDTLPSKILNKIDIHQGDIRDKSSVYAAVKDVDIVFNLAAMIGIPFSYSVQDLYVDTNIKGTLNILQVAKELKTEKIIHTSTSEVYGSAQYTPIDEKHPINPQSPYAATKASSDYLALSFYKSFDIPVTVIRPFNTFGPRQSARAVIPTIIIQALSGISAIRLGNVNTTRDFTYVSDTVEAFIKVAEANNTYGNVYNCANNQEVSIKELVSITGKILNKKLIIRNEKLRFRPKNSEVKRLVGDFEKLQSSCDWEPRISLERGISLTSSWLKHNLNKYKPQIYNI